MSEFRVAMDDSDQDSMVTRAPEPAGGSTEEAARLEMGAPTLTTSTSTKADPPGRLFGVTVSDEEVETAAARDDTSRSALPKEAVPRDTGKPEARVSEFSEVSSLKAGDKDSPHDAEAGPSTDEADDSENHEDMATLDEPQNKKNAASEPMFSERAKKQKLDEAPKKKKNRIENLGNDETGMCLVYPPDDPDVPAVVILKELEAKLRNQKVLKKIQTFIKDNEDGDEPESARLIQGKRFEIFLDAKGKASKAFDTVIVPTMQNQNAKEIILEYARSQAQMDPRVQDGYIFENFSLLVCQRAAPAQAPHVDLVTPNFQFGMVLSNKSRGTLFVPEPDKLGRLHHVDQLVSLWEKNPFFKDDAFSKVPPRLVERFKADLGAQQLLSYFGDTLHPEKTLRDSFVSKDRLPVGTVSCLPGSVCHAGPATTAPRSVLFFSGAPKDSDEVDPYMPDSQYNGVTLMGHLVSIFWRQESITAKDRQFLLRMLAKYVQSSSSKDVADQFGEGKLRDCVRALQNKRYSSRKMRMTQEEFIKDRSEDLSIVVGNDPFSQPNAVIDVTDLKLVSVEKNLFTAWKENDEECSRDLALMVYQRISDGKIVLRYVTEGDDALCPDEYEGHLEHERYRLEMNSPGEKFDGSNGRLLDTDGELIEVHLGRRIHID
ncbi:expressed unknown protein [Seminavis robusta]|uniref:Uncharacterized protein n=1 Tax=Seminavis robusta TaxID=568900 RepID=A0A9N8H652_9STRA|nr:expressed unknown protein [Seminavis robusta]|eukprot:Sro161_g072530.1 n/a (658) ;mRNA; r:59008-60981